MDFARSTHFNRFFVDKIAARGPLSSKLTSDIRAHAFDLKLSNRDALSSKGGAPSIGSESQPLQPVPMEVLMSWKKSTTSLPLVALAAAGCVAAPLNQDVDDSNENVSAPFVDVTADSIGTSDTASPTAIVQDPNKNA